MKDQLKSILDIPNIEEYKNLVFNFKCYSIGDSTAMYEAYYDSKTISIELISDRGEIFPNEKLSDLCNSLMPIAYFTMSIRDLEENVIESYEYAPLKDKENGIVSNNR